MSENGLEFRNKEKKELLSLLSDTTTILEKTYLPVLSSKKANENTNNETRDFSEINETIRFFKINQIVLNKSENMRDKLVSVFNAIESTESSLIYLIQGNASVVNIYLGIRIKKNEESEESKDNYNKVFYAQNVLQNSLNGNFPGTKTEIIKEEDLKKEIYAVTFKEDTYVAAISDIPAQRSDQENKERLFIQGIEKFIEAMQGQNEEYSLLLIADYVSNEKINEEKKALEDIYSFLYPYANTDLSLGKNESFSVSKSEGSNEGVSKTAWPQAVGNIIGLALGIGGAVASGGTASSAPFIGGQIGGAIGGLFGQTEQKGKDKHGAKTSSNGSSTTTQIKFENHTIKRLLSKIDELLKLYDKANDLGMWECAAYCLSDKKYVAQSGASIYQSLLRGKNSSLSNSAINIWDSDDSKNILNSLKLMKHPIFGEGKISLTPAVLISSAELAIEAAFPNHSIPGIPVVECAEFGRTISTYNEQRPEFKKINIGNYFYMNHEDENRKVELTIDNFASHVFVTGSTGSGKSTTIYKILSELSKTKYKGEENVYFMVIEPAKGEYKNVFGKRPLEIEEGKQEGIAKVYGTNPEYNKLLRINPFSFPEGISVTEHLERLIEIFNACWPMYAAMPQVLKDAVSRAYEDCGWDLKSSYCSTSFPTFNDVLRNIKTIINSSEYSDDTKGDYKGALETRLKSMTNGSNAQIFVRNELTNQDLFENNVIVDLHRLGSTETRSLIMGLLVLKLQEYRMSESLEPDSNLRHITVLEEAHNLLRRTSTEQENETANLAGKSVEMITNSIAEMRTYGEVFIIADQAPGLLDMAVIRNTNTKVIMRLPDYSDRELVGKAANLNKDQIDELAKLPDGVAAIYQNQWIQPILAKIKPAEDLVKGFYPKEKDKTSVNQENSEKLDIQERIKFAELLIERDFDKFNKIIENKSFIQKKSEFNIYKKMYLKNPENIEYRSHLISSLLPEYVQMITENNIVPSMMLEFLKEEIKEDFSNIECKEKILSAIYIHYCIVNNKKEFLM